MGRAAAPVPAEQVEPFASVTVPEGPAAAGLGAGVERLDRPIGPRAAHPGPTVGVEAAEQLLVLGHQTTGVLGVRRWDDVPVVVLGDRQQPVEVPQIVRGRTCLLYTSDAAD